MYDNVSFKFPTMINDTGEIRGIDNLFSSERRFKYDTKKCGRCKSLWNYGLNGWYVPNFSAYFDRDYYCPKCLVFYQHEYVNKNESIKVADVKLKELNEQYSALPYESSRIFKNEKGELYLDASYAGEEITIQMLEEESSDYKAREKDIEAVRDSKYRLSKEIEQQKEIKRVNYVGSGFNPQANT